MALLIDRWVLCFLISPVWLCVPTCVHTVGMLLPWIIWITTRQHIYFPPSSASATLEACGVEWCDYKIFSGWYERREVEGGGPHVCVCVSVCHHQLGRREGAPRSTIRRWGHFSVAPQSATRQELTLHTAPQSDQIIILTGRMTVILVQWWQTNSKVVSSYLSDLMRLKLSEEHSFHQTHKPSVTPLPDGPQWALLWNSWLILNGNKGFGSINLSTKSKVYSTRSCSFFWQPHIQSS